MTPFSRRDFMKLAGLTAASSALAACAPEEGRSTTLPATAIPEYPPISPLAPVPAGELPPLAGLWL